MKGSRGRRRATQRSLSSGEEFNTVYRTGTRHVSSLATVYVLPRQEGPLRLGVPAGRRVGRAVARNRLRRRVREALARLRPAISGGADVVVVPRAIAAQAPFGSLVRVLADALLASGVLSAGEGRAPDGQSDNGRPTR